MKVRKVMGLTVAVPALVVALAQPSDAASRAVVTFAGTIEVVAYAVPQQTTLDVCFFASATCENGAESGGMAAGAAVDTATFAPKVVDGLQARATYAETCAPVTGLQSVATANLSGKVHEALGNAWRGSIAATWTRAGLVAVIQGDAVGTALFTPLAAPACGRPVPVAVAGAVQLAY